MKKQHFKPVDSKTSLPKLEHEILEFWEREKIFEESVAQRKGKPKYVFFDGPPFANGLPHYGHILANALKDAVTRYWTMRGFHVPRVNGWDCHGLPVEYEIEKELKISGRKDIEKMGVAKFNTECRKSVFKYTEEWEKLLRRIGRWVDFEHSYATLENEYMESIWWVFKEIWKKGMVYQGHKSMHICPRCETPLSNFEVTLGYKDVTDISVYLKFKLTDGPEKGAYVLAWTTTPWTLPGNMLLAFNKEIEYVLVESEEEKFILARSRLDAVFKDKKYKIIKKIKAKELEGNHYEPLFDYFADWKDAYRAVLADFVTVENGTGVVHIAPAFGEDDLQLGLREKITPICHVTLAGIFIPEVTDFAGKFAKGQDLNIKDYLQNVDKLFYFENYRHSYPHCWRCDTPLLNYSTKAWFIRVTDIKEKLLKNNKRIHWVPEHIQEGRFGKWLSGVRDWNISRNRFWGCPIPVWQCECGNQTCVGSLKELRENSIGGNTFFVVRHGESGQNDLKVLNSDPKNIFHLTKEGIGQVETAANKLKNKKIDMIFCSNFPRATETAEIFAKKLDTEVIIDNRLREHEMGIFEGKDNESYIRSFADLQERYYKKIKGGESFEEMENRVIEFINYLNRKYSGKNIVIVTHGDVIRAIARYFERLSIEETFKFKPGLAAVYEYHAGKLPLREGKLDLHKPYIDEVELKCEKCAKSMKRIPEVLDCWFESGSMPYAQLHYPFENRKEFEDNFPAHFIAEGLDQTRGWFYTLHILSTILFDKPAFNNVIVNGILLAADGEKLSKRKKNYPDPNTLFETYGVDSMRFFLFTSTAPLAEDVRFSEKHVEELVKQFTLMLWNTYSFFVTYANIDGWKPSTSYKLQATSYKLDEWIISELNALTAEVTKYMDEYNFTKATRPLIHFVDNLSNWYVRRSRRRFWKSENDEDKNAAYQTLYTVLVTLSKLIAPFMPATADAIYKNLTGEKSVHLIDWPKIDQKSIKTGLNEEIHVVRTIVSLALKLRSKKNIKVRQPLAKLLLALPKRINKKSVETYKDVILEELNVKEMIFEEEGRIATHSVTVDSRKIGPRFGADTQKIIALAKENNYSIQPDGTVNFPAKGKPQYVLQRDEVNIGFRGREGFEVESCEGILVSLDTNITEELEKEGYARDIIRFLQELRKKAGYNISDRIYIYINAPKKIQDAVTTFADIIKRETLATELQEGGDFEWDKEETVEIDGQKVKLGVRI
ncbi:class I tRNA ligase family protein [Candidatus Peregrinibacteria bacterium]|nr:class I tRNA ligase family protein [Candidatus Peregrinibacteria bacterium]